MDSSFEVKDYYAQTIGLRYKTPVATEFASHPGLAEAFLTLCRAAPADAVVLPVGLHVESRTYCDTPRLEHDLGIDFDEYDWHRPHQHKWIVETTVSSRAFEHVDEDHMDVVYSFGMKNRVVRAVVKPSDEEMRASWVAS